MTNRELLNIMGKIDDRYIEEADIVSVQRKSFHQTAKLTAVAACLFLALGVGAGSMFSFNEAEHTPKISAVVSESPVPGGRKILSYNGYRYAFIGDGTEFDFSHVKLGKALGTLHEASSSDQSQVGSCKGDQDFCATFAAGGTLYEIPNYSVDFRVAVAFDGAYYIAELAGKVDNTPLDILYYLDKSGLSEHVEGAVIQDHMGMEKLKEVSKKDAENIVECLRDGKTAELSEGDYESIGSAQAEGKSFLFSFVLDDSTTVDMYIIPEMGYISVGDDFYKLPKQFTSDFAQLFQGLQQGPLPLS